MLSSLRHLMAIQELDARAALVQAELAGLPDQRDAVQRDVVDAARAVDETKQAIEDAELNERRLENDMREQEALIRRLEDQTAEVATRQGYEALQHEMARAREAGSIFETQALELMETIDRARAQLAVAEEQHRKLSSFAPEQSRQLSERETELTADAAELVRARESECRSLKPDRLQVYERARKRHQPCIVVLKTNSCPACHIAVPTQLSDTIQRGEALQVCSGCNRLLVSALALEHD